MKRLFVVNVLLLLFLSGCVEASIKGKDLKESFVRSDYYTVEYGVETHFEMGTLMPLATYNVCDDEVYYQDEYGNYEITDSKVITYLNMNDKQFKVEVDNPKVFSIPSYDLDMFEEEIWEREFNKSIFSRRYSNRDENYNIYFNSTANENFSYMIIEMYGEEIFQFTNRTSALTCFDDKESFELYTEEELVSELLDYVSEWYHADINVLDIIYDEIRDETRIITDQAQITLALSRGEVFFDFEGVNDLYMDIDTELYSVYSFENDEMVYSRSFPSTFSEIYDDAEGRTFVEILNVYNRIFREISYE